MIRSGPPGSAGVPPACTPVAHRSVSLRCGTRPPCRRQRHGLGQSWVLAPLPLEPGGGDSRGCARPCAGGTPALPGGLHPPTSSQPRNSIGIRVHSSFVFEKDRQFLPRMICPAGQGRHLFETKEKSDPRRDTKRDGSAASAGPRPGKPARAHLRSKSDGKWPTRERGRPARMHSRCAPLSFPAMWHPATLPAVTAWARTKLGPGAVARRAGGGPSLRDL